MLKQGFEKGRSDVLFEVKLLQAYGLWTKVKRASWVKKAVSEQLSFKHRMPWLPQVSAYYAGRVAGLRSALTAQYPAPYPEISSLTVFLPVTGSSLPWCQLSDCKHIAAWECYLRGDYRMILLCDCCRERLLALVPRMREGLLEVFRRPIPSSPHDWLSMLDELADTTVWIGWRNPEDKEPVMLSAGEVAGTLVRQPVAWAVVYWSWRLLPPVGIALLFPMLMALLLSMRQRKEDTHEHRSLFL